MEAVVLVVHLFIALGLIGVVLLQRSEGGALGMGGGSGGFMTGRGTANLLTRTTAALAGLFFLTSIGLTLMAKKGEAPSPIDRIPVSTPAPAAPSAPAAPGSDASKPAPATAPAGAPATAPAQKDATPAPAPAPQGGGLLDSLEKGKSALPKVPRSQ